MITDRLHLGRRRRWIDCSVSRRRLNSEAAAAAAAAADCVMTKLYADQHQHQHHQHQITFKVDHRETFKSESMSSLSDFSDVPAPPTDDVDTQLISRVYGIGRKPTTIALTFRPPRKQRFTDKLPKLVNKSKKSNGRRPSNDATLYSGCGGVVIYDSDDSRVISGRQHNRMMTSKSMHFLSKTNAEVSRRVTLPAADGSGIRTLTTLSDRRQTSSEAKEHQATNDGLTPADRQPTTVAARSNSVINKYFIIKIFLIIVM